MVVVTATYQGLVIFERERENQHTKKTKVMKNGFKIKNALFSFCHVNMSFYFCPRTTIIVEKMVNQLLWLSVAAANALQKNFCNEKIYTATKRLKVQK